MHPGVLLGPYRLTAPLGAGGFGSVWDATETLTGERVALKVLGQLTSDLMIGLKEEVRALLSLAHPNLVAPYELLVVGKQWCFAMERVEGMPLDDWIAGRPGGQRLQSIVDCFRQLTDAVEFLHASGVLHLDLKPANILVRHDGRIAVLDFGLAQRVAHAARQVAGTPGYVAPEVARGEVPGPQADWFAVGVMLQAVLTRADRDRPVAGTESRLRGALWALAGWLMERDPSLRADGAALFKVLNEEDRRFAPRRYEADLVGRADALETLWQAFGETLAGKFRIVLVEGGSGIGKTRLLDAFAASLLDRETEGFWLRGQASEQQRVPYPTIDSVLDQLARHIHALPPGPGATVLGEETRVLARTFPAFGQRGDDTAASDDPDDLLALHRAIRGVLERARARAPCVVCIDDAQWMDGDSAQLLAGVLGVNPPPVLLVLLAREVSPPVAALLDMVPIESQVRLALTPLMDADARFLLGRLLPSTPDQGVLAAMVAFGGGNPFLLREAALGATEGSRSVAEAVLRRAGRLGEDAMRLMEVVAVCSTPIDVETAIAVAETVDRRRSVHLLCAGHLLSRGHANGVETLVSAHAQVREAVRMALPDGRARALHHRLAHRLTTAGYPAGVRAMHFHLGGDDSTAASLAREAALEAERALAFHQAAGAWADAVAWGRWAPAESIAMRVRRATCLFNAGYSAEAGRFFLEAAADADVLTAAILEERAAQALLLAGDFEGGLSALGATLSRLRLKPPSRGGGALVAALVDLVVTALAIGPRGATPGSLTARQIDLFWGAGLGLLATLPLESLALLAKSLRVSLAFGDLERAARVGGLLDLVLAQFPALRWLGRRIAVKVADAPRSSYLDAVEDLWGAHTRYYQGDWEGMRRLASASFTRLRSECVGARWEAARARELELLGHWLAGDLRRVGRLAEEALQESEHLGDRFASTNARQYLGYHALSLGRVETARAQAAWILGQWAPGHYTVAHFFALVGETWADLYEGRALAARARVASHAPRWRAVGGHRIPLWRIDWRVNEVRVLAATAGEPGVGKRLARLAIDLSVETRADARSHATYAGLAADLVTAPYRAGRGRVEEAVQAYEAAGHALFANCLALEARALGMMGKRGDAAEQALTDAGVARPALLAHALTPLPRAQTPGMPSPVLALDRVPA